MKHIRNSVKALIIHEDKILAIKCRREGEVGDIVFIRDYIANNHEFAQRDPDFHQVEIMFECRLSQGARPALTESKDTFQIGIDWLPIADLSQLPLYPKVFREILGDQQKRIYLGDVN